ncbi:hypothetical protein EXN66_Car011003 [Channa argus]|uniref:Uncharacterized protein n=1 Tax=Channa argus TaxID=215402 RepID=A0A6G1PYK5_CHAAH|nr:hypothetical protein EXN66_Car011003 [Channa argus]
MVFIKSPTPFLLAGPRDGFCVDFNVQSQTNVKVLGRHCQSPVSSIVKLKVVMVVLAVLLCLGFLRLFNHPVSTRPFQASGLIMKLYKPLRTHLFPIGNSSVSYLVFSRRKCRCCNKGSLLLIFAPRS